MHPLRSLPLLACGLLSAAIPALAEPWKFGIMGDTQWGNDVDGENPNTVAVGIINQVNAEMVRQGVKFVLAVGDITDKGSSNDSTTAASAVRTRVTFVQELYNNGIGFFPLRGNHEDSKVGAATFLRVFPQTRSGVQDSTPVDDYLWTDSANIHPAVPVEGHGTFTAGSLFSSPAGLEGLSYAFHYGNATFVLIDQFQNASGSKLTVPQQQAWIDSVLAARDSGTHAFVACHKGLIMSNHVDNLFGSAMTSDTAGLNAFLLSLRDHDARFLFAGHDHMHEYSLVSTTDSVSANVHQLIAASESMKFYTPGATATDEQNVTAFGVHRQIPLSQELYAVGFYIVTVDGPNVRIDHYAVPNVSTNTITSTPELTGNWKWREAFGSSLAGREFVVEQGASYTAVADTFQGTKMRILWGRNTAANTDYNGRALRQLVTTGWSDADSLPGQRGSILSLLGMRSSLGSDTTPPFALEMSYDKDAVDLDSLLRGLLHIARRDTAGAWSLAAAPGAGETATLTLRPWTESDTTVGACGVDTAAGSVWTVMDTYGEFVLAAVSDLVSDYQGETTSLAADASSAASQVRLVDGRFLIADRASSVRLTDLRGRLVLQRDMAAGERLELDCPAGTYTLRDASGRSLVTVR